MSQPGPQAEHKRPHLAVPLIWGTMDRVLRGRRAQAQGLERAPGCGASEALSTSPHPALLRSPPLHPHASPPLPRTPSLHPSPPPAPSPPARFLHPFSILPPPPSAVTLSPLATRLYPSFCILPISRHPDLLLSHSATLPYCSCVPPPSAAAAIHLSCPSPSSCLTSSSLRHPACTSPLAPSSVRLPLLFLPHPLHPLLLSFLLLGARCLSSDLGLLTWTRAPLAAALPPRRQKGLQGPGPGSMLGGQCHLGRIQEGRNRPSGDLYPQRGHKGRGCR